MLVLAIIFSVGEIYLIATYTQFEIWAKTDEYKSIAYELANTILSNKYLATKHIIIYSKQISKYDGKDIPYINLCDVDFQIDIKVKINNPTMNHNDEWVIRSYDINSPLTNYMKPITYIDVPVLVLYDDEYNNKKIVLPGKMEISIFKNVYKKISCHMRAAILSKDETFSIGCLNETKNGNCKIILSKKYSDGTAQTYHICFDNKCEICENTSKSVYLALGSGVESRENHDCEIIFNETYYNFPGSGIMNINLTGSLFKFDVYKSVN